MLSRDLEKSLHRALAMAAERRHEFATLEHLLLALLEDPDAVAVLKACDVDIDRLAHDLEGFIDEELENLAAGELAAGEQVEAKPTTGFQRVVQRAVLHVQSSGRTEATGANILVAIFSERESHAVFFLQEQDMSRYDAVNYISHRIAKVPGQSGPDGSPSGADEDIGEEQVVKEGASALDAFCVNLNAKAQAGRIDPLIGRNAEIERTIQVLCRRTKNNPLYVGDAGVGKTALAEGLARRIEGGEVPQVLDGAVIFAPRHGHAARRHALPRRFRGADQGRAGRDRSPRERHPVHRRDSHRHRRGRHQRRGDGRLQPAQAGAAEWHAALHRLHHLPRNTATISRRTAPSPGASRRST